MSTVTRSVGADQVRVEAAEKVTGQALYSDDHRLARATHVAIVQSAIARGTVTNVDAERARDHPRLHHHGQHHLHHRYHQGDAAFAAAAVTVDDTYSTPAEHNNPMEPHATTACWQEGSLTLYDSTQGAHAIRRTVAAVFGLDERRALAVRRRRLRLQGDAPAALGPRGDGGMRTARPARLASRGSRCSRWPAIARRPSSASAWAPTRRGTSRRSRTTSSSRLTRSTSSPSRRPSRRG